MPAGCRWTKELPVADETGWPRRACVRLRPKASAQSVFARKPFPVDAKVTIDNNGRCGKEDASHGGAGIATEDSTTPNETSTSLAAWPA